MPSRDPVISRRRPAPILYAALLAVAFLLTRLMPPTGDDWSRIAFEPRTARALLERTWQSYTGHNGRILGNGLSFALIEPVWVRAGAKAAAIVGLVALTSWLVRSRSPGTVLLTFGGLLLVPPGVFRESYGWSAGFFNYVPPMLAVLLLAGLLGGRGRQGSRGRRAVVVALAGLATFAGCLFVEHVTAALATLAVGGGLIGAIRRRFDAAILAAALGAVLGTITMLASPGLREVGRHQDAYFSYAASLHDLIATAVPNYALITQSFVLSNAVLLTLLSVAVLGRAALGGSAGRRGWPDLLIAAGMLGVAAYALLSRVVFDVRLTCTDVELTGCHRRALRVDLLALVLLLAVLVAAASRYLRPGHERATFAALLIATLAMLGPLLIVAPIGPRNVYGPTVTLLAIVALLARPLLDSPARTRRVVATALLGALCVTGVGGLFVIERANAAVAAERVAAMAAAVRSGAPSVELTPFPYRDWVHQPRDQKIGVRYFRDHPRDIEVIAR
ncbi:MAG: DUF6056 family protein [Tetrasphaera sp.]